MYWYHIPLYVLNVVQMNKKKCESILHSFLQKKTFRLIIKSFYHAELFVN